MTLIGKLVLPSRYPFDIEEGTMIKLAPCIKNPTIYAGLMGGVEIGIIDEVETSQLENKSGKIKKRISPTIYEILIN